MPFNIIMENAGLNSAFIESKIAEYKDKSYGYDAKSNVYGNMYEMGIVDPAKVARIAIETASSIACTFITTDCVITPVKIERK